MLHAVGEAVGLAPVAGSVLGNVEWNWVHSQWLWGCRTAQFSEVWSSFLFQNRAFSWRKREKMTHLEHLSIGIKASHYVEVI